MIDTKRWLLSALLSFCWPVSQAIACDIVYGDNWTFVSPTPERWRSQCGDAAPQGTNVILWPEGQRLDSANAVIYVSVFEKKAPDLQHFVSQEQASFLKDAPNASIVPMPAPRIRGMKYVLARINNAPGAKHELVAYTEGPNAYYLIVMSNDSEKILNDNRGVFARYMRDFVPMKRSNSR
jgi:hypothetical protein